MRAILFGGTGMVGQGVLRELLLDPGVVRVLAVGRRTTGKQHEKLGELAHGDFADFSAVENQLTGYDACFFCLGTSSAGMSEADYTRVTYDFSLAAATVLARRNSAMTFTYVSGSGTNERGRMMWARVKGRTESALMALPFKASYMFRPAYIQPLHGIVASARMVRVMYATLRPFYRFWKAILPNYVTTTEAVGKAMIRVARDGAEKRVLENRDINAMAATLGPA